MLDPRQALDGRFDVAFAHGRVAAIAADLSVSAAEVIDVSGKLITPGLIDLHGHFFHRGQPLFADPDAVCLPNGVATGVDAGRAGWATYSAFREYVIVRASSPSAMPPAMRSGAAAGSPPCSRSARAAAGAPASSRRLKEAHLLRWRPRPHAG